MVPCDRPWIPEWLTYPVATSVERDDLADNISRIFEFWSRERRGRVEDLAQAFFGWPVNGKRVDETGRRYCHFRFICARKHILQIGLIKL